MGIGTGIAIYFVIWWTTLFVTLPFRMKAQVATGEVVEGTDPAAPADPQMLRRFIINTVFSGLVFFLFWLVVYHFGFGLDSIPEIIPIRRLDS
ncbi:MAG: DUF1467 family protein [Pseudomonadota bacterium]